MLCPYNKIYLDSVVVYTAFTAQIFVLLGILVLFSSTNIYAFLNQDTFTWEPYLLEIKWIYA